MSENLVACVWVSSPSALSSVCSLESPVLKWLCLMWCSAATLVLLVFPKLIVDTNATLDAQVGRLLGAVNMCMCVQGKRGHGELRLTPLCLLTQSPTGTDSIKATGYVCGYLSSIFYLCSRFPQLYKNVSGHFFSLRVCFHFLLEYFSGGPWRTV